MKAHPRLPAVFLVAFVFGNVGLLSARAADSPPTVVVIPADDQSGGGASVRTRPDIQATAMSDRETVIAEDSQPNVLFLAIDDLNDWIGALGGHPQARTPNLDRLISKSVVFHNAHCAAPVCSASRHALLSGLRPSTTGWYSNGVRAAARNSLSNWSRLVIVRWWQFSFSSKDG